MMLLAKHFPYQLSPKHPDSRRLRKIIGRAWVRKPSDLRCLQKTFCLCYIGIVGKCSHFLSKYCSSSRAVIAALWITRTSNNKDGKAFATAAIVLPRIVCINAVVALTRESDSPVSRPGTVGSRSIDRMDHTNITNTGRFTSGVAISPSGCALCTDDTSPVQGTAWNTSVSDAAASTSISLGSNCLHALHRHGIGVIGNAENIPSTHSNRSVSASDTRLHKQ